MPSTEVVDMSFLRIALLAGLVLLVALALLFAAIVIDDRGYPDFVFEEPPDEPRARAVLLVWSASPGLWESYGEDVLPVLRKMQQKGQVRWVLAFEHKELSHPTLGGAWGHAAVVMLGGRDDARAVEEIIAAAKGSSSAEHLEAIDLVELQRGLDMIYPATDGLAREGSLVHILEYVFSDEEARPEYYRDQVVFSGPAMRDLYLRDKAGRFVGFEVHERLFGAPGMPEWDVFHIVGFTPWQMVKSIPSFRATWAKHAERVYGEGATLETQRSRWDEIRLNVSSRATQRMTMSLQSTGEP